MRILLVEDNPDDADLVRALLLESDGQAVEVEHVVRVSEALERLHAGDIQLVLLDLGLPDADGMDAACGGASPPAWGACRAAGTDRGRGRIRALAETAGVASHEINNPLAVIVGNLELLSARNDLSPHDRDMLGIVREAAGRIERIVRDTGQTRRYATKKYIQDTNIVDFQASSDTERT